MSEAGVLRYDVDGHVGVITLTRPEAMNSLTYQSYRCPVLFAAIREPSETPQKH